MDKKTFKKPPLAKKVWKINKYQQEETVSNQSPPEVVLDDETKRAVITLARISREDSSVFSAQKRVVGMNRNKPCLAPLIVPKRFVLPVYKIDL